MWVLQLFEIILKLGFDDGDLWAVDDLHAAALFDDTSGTAFLEGGFRHKLGVVYRYAKSGSTAVDRHDILSAAKPF